MYDSDMYAPKFLVLRYIKGHGLIPEIVETVRPTLTANDPQLVAKLMAHRKAA